MTVVGAFLIAGAAIALFFIWRARNARRSDGDWESSRRLDPSRSRIVDRVERPLTLDIVYGDADGVVTERSVTVLAVEFDQDTGDAIKLEAWCHFRQASRHFRPDRIIEMRHSETGTLIHRPARFLAEWAIRESALRRMN